MQIIKKEHGFDEPLGLLSDCHRRIERFLAILQKVASDAPPESLPTKYREGLQTALDYFDQAAPKHTRDEEDSLFPRISGDLEASQVIARLEADHLASEPLHHTVDCLGRLWLKAGLLEGTQRSVFQESVEQLLELYREHIRIEDEELFPLAASLLDQSALREVGGEMAARRGLSVKSD